MYFLKIGLVALVIGFTSISSAQVVMQSSVLGSGATVSAGGAILLAGTIGQTLIGLSSGPQTDRQGFWYTVRPRSATGVEGYLPLSSAGGIELSKNYPNPFSDQTRFAVTMATRSSIRLTLFDNLGREVRELLEGEFDPGVVTVHVPAAGLRPGQYFVRLSAGAERRTVAISVVK